jgi:hypothetical protein
MNRPKIASASLFAALLLVRPAAAQEKDAAMTADAMAVESSRPLLLRKAPPRNATGLGGGNVAMIAGAIEQARFDVQPGDFSSPEIPAWCMRSAADAAQKAGDVDAKGQAVVTSSALQERCSSVYAYTLEVRHGCASRIERDKNRKTRTVWACDVNATVVITKAAARMTPAGTPELAQDRAFGGGGSYVLHASGSSTNPSRDAAERSAASSAAYSLERDIRDVPGFQLRGPLTDATTATADFCLGRDVLELDQPFYMVKVNERGDREDVGWGKVRDIHDGCVATDAMEARAGEGAQFDLKPARIETIIGRGDVKAGMTALEMPTLGLNFGLQGGTTAAPGGTSAVRVDLMLEADVARYSGISELYAFAHLGLAVPDDEARKTVLQQIELLDTAPSNGMVGVQGDFGLMKRTYFGRPFLDLGGAFTFGSYYASKATDWQDLVVYGGGVAGKVGLGFQASPRVALRLLAQGRYAVLGAALRSGSSSSSSSSSSNEVSVGSPDPEAGVGVTFGFLYTL